MKYLKSFFEKSSCFFIDKIFNEKLVDELIVLDIDATVEKKEPNYQLISNLAFNSKSNLT